MIVLLCQVEPVDLSTGGTSKQLFSTLSLSSFLQTHINKETQDNKDNPEDVDEAERQQRLREWSKSKKMHACHHPGCDKVHMIIS